MMVKHDIRGFYLDSLSVLVRMIYLCVKKISITYAEAMWDGCDLAYYEILVHS